MLLFRKAGSFIIILMLMLCLINFIEVLERRLSTEHVQYEHSNQVATETLKQERDQLRLQLEQQVQDNDQIIK